ncbi:MAG: LLM class flavin-dependent oxidoreductase [Rhodothermales bacterium]|nr:LLM class flavin-dependent oxidoreductase [Rhodothermales bacterium]
MSKSNSGSFSAVFMGSESLLIRCAGILSSKGHKIEAVVSDNAEILEWAESESIRAIRPGRDLQSDLDGCSFDYFFSVTNFRIVPESVLKMARRSAVNFHDGVLPDYAGLNVPSWAIINGESSHGITWHEMSDGIDEGAILEQVTFEIDAGDTSFELNTKCYEAAATSFENLVNKLAAGAETRLAQDLSKRAYFSRDKRPFAGGIIDWGITTTEICNLIRALNYGAYDNPLGYPKVIHNGKVFYPITAEHADESGQPGSILDSGPSRLVVASGDGAVAITEMVDAAGNQITDFAAAGFRKQSTIDTLSKERLLEIDAQVQAAAKAERAWLPILRNLNRFDLSLLGNFATGAHPAKDSNSFTLPGGISDRDALSAALVTLGKISGQSDFSVQVKLDVDRAALPTFRETVPVEVGFSADSSLASSVETIREAVDAAVDRGSFAIDLPLRDTRLRDSAGDLFPRVLVATTEPTNQNLEDFSIVLFAADETLSLFYDSAGLSENEANVLSDRLSAALEFFAADSQRSVADLPVVTESEAAHLVTELNNTAGEFDSESCLHQIIARQAAESPDSPALTFRGSSVTYRQMDERANQVAHLLKTLGVGPDTLVGLCTDRSPDLVISALAVWKAGGAYVPLDPDFPAERLEHMVRDSELRVIITQAALLAGLPESEAVIVDLDDASRFDGLPTTAPETDVSPQNLAYAIYTSGSTGLPKGVLVEHRNVSNFFSGMDAVIQVSERKTWLAVTSLSFDISVLELFWTLCRGFEVVLFEGVSASGSIEGVSRNAAEMDFSLFYFSSDESERPGDKYRLLMEGARFADENGFYGVWTPERHFHAFGGLYPNPAVTSAALAAITSNVRLFAGSCVSPLHHSIRIAEDWSVVDNLSNGRVAIAFASGWQPNDFVLQPQNFADKKNVMFRQIEEVQKLWSGETLSFQNPEGKDIQVRTLPRPVQDALPVWITTAGNPETFRMAGERGYNILTHMLGQTVNDVRDAIRIYRETWAAAGHEGNGHVSLMLHTFVGTDSDRVREIVKEPMKQYLRSSLGLIRDAAWSFPTFRQKTTDGQGKFTMDNLSEKDTDAVMDLSFERYYASAGLFGTVEQCVEIVDGLKDLGVNEVACLVDFGVETDLVLESLPLLKEVMDASNRSSEDSTATLDGLIARHNVSHMQCTPSMARMLISDAEGMTAASNLDHLMVGGEAFPPSLARDLAQNVRGRVTNMYGPTETTIWSSTYDVEEIMNPMPIGRPILNTQLYILDASLGLVPKGIPGELYIGGAGVTRGYHNRPELTQERFVDDPFQHDGGRMYKTGDLCKYLPDGRIQFLGRNDFQVKIRGYRIELGEIESVLDSHESVHESVVIVREDTEGDQRITAYVVGSKIDTSIITAHIRGKVPDYMVPADIVYLDQLPLTPNKKIDRNALPAPKRLRSTNGIEVATPENDLEQQIAGIWQEALKLDQISVTDNFFDLGGHSLLAVQVNDKLKAMLSKDISLVDLFRYPTIRTLSSFLSQDNGEGAEAAKEAGSSRAEERRKAMLRRRRVRGAGQ